MKIIEHTVYEDGTVETRRGTFWTASWSAWLLLLAMTAVAVWFVAGLTWPLWAGLL